MVQAAHAALELGLRYEIRDHVSSLIVLQVPDKTGLEKALRKCSAAGLRTIEFHEPDWDYGLTAFAVEPLEQHQRHVFRSWRLWKAPC